MIRRFAGMESYVVTVLGNQKKCGDRIFGTPQSLMNGFLSFCRIMFASFVKDRVGDGDPGLNGGYDQL